MGFRSKSALGITIVLLWGMTAAARNDESPHITVRVQNSAEVGPGLLRRAQAETSRVFELADIVIDWVNCSRLTHVLECDGPPGTNEFVLHVVPGGKTRADIVFGESFLGEDGSGKYSDIFFRRIATVQCEQEVDAAQILGAVSAHELGHLLLGSNAHSSTGIMRPMWTRESLREIGMGKLYFTPAQSRLMRSRIHRDGSHLILAREKIRSSFDGWY